VKQRATGSALILLATLAIASPSDAAEPFHDPKTPAETALDEAFMVDDRLPSKHREDFTGVLTPRLIASIIKDEPAEIRRCDRRPQPRTECGIRYWPIGCAADGDALYRTDRSTVDSAEISVQWSEDEEDPVNRYRLVRLNGKWLVDEVYCSTGTIEYYGRGFNWLDRLKGRTP
jgi:hypothetical protein